MENKQDTEPTKESVSNGATKQEEHKEEKREESKREYSKKEPEGKTSLFVRNVSRRVRYY